PLGRLERADRSANRGARAPQGWVDRVHRLRLPLARPLQAREPRRPCRASRCRAALLDRRPPDRRLNSAARAGTVCQASRLAKLAGSTRSRHWREGEAMQARRWRPLLVLATAAALSLGIGVTGDIRADVGSGSGPPTSIGHGGAAASVEKIATQAAIDTLEKGGNAIDAAVAAAGVLGVTEPFSCGVGGGGFMVIRTADGKVTTIDGRETASAAMTPTSFWENGVPLDFNNARFSGMSVGVPGTVATWA